MARYVREQRHSCKYKQYNLILNQKRNIKPLCIICSLMVKTWQVLWPDQPFTKCRFYHTSALTLNLSNKTKSLQQGTGMSLVHVSKTSKTWMTSQVVCSGVNRKIVQMFNVSRYAQRNGKRSSGNDIVQSTNHAATAQHIKSSSCRSRASANVRIQHQNCYW